MSSLLTSGDDGYTEVRYVEVPQIEYKEILVPKIQTIEIEKRVPKIEIVEVEKEVEVLELHHVTKEVEKVIEQEVIKKVPRREVVEVPVEVVKQVPRYETVYREEIVNVPGEIIEVPRTVALEHRVPVPVYHDQHREAMVAQTVQPIIRQIPAAVDVGAVDYDPVLCKVIIPIPKPVPSPLFWGGKLEDRFCYTAVPPRQYNGLIQAFNRHLSQNAVQDLFVRNAAGHPIPPVGEQQLIVSPMGPVEGPKPPTPYISSLNVMAPGAINSSLTARGASEQQAKGRDGFTDRGSHSVATRDPSHGPRRLKPTMEQHYHTPKGTWLGSVMRDFGRDADADQYYREHHEYFMHALQSPRRAPSRPVTASGQRSSRRRTRSGNR